MWVQSIISQSIFAPMVSTASQPAGRSLLNSVEDLRVQLDIGSHVTRFSSLTVRKILILNYQCEEGFHKRSNSNSLPCKRDARQRGLLRKKNCDKDLVFNTVSKGNNSFDSSSFARVAPREEEKNDAG